MVAIQAIKISQDRNDNKANVGWAMMTVNRTSRRRDIIPRKDGEVVMKKGGDGGKADENEWRYDGAKEGRGEVGYHESGR